MQTILFHSATGGVGRTLCSVAITTFLCNNGLIAYLDLTGNPNQITGNSDAYFKPGTTWDGGFQVPTNRETKYITDHFNMDNIRIYRRWDKLIAHSDRYKTVIINAGPGRVLGDAFLPIKRIDAVVSPFIFNNRSLMGTVADLNTFNQRWNYPLLIPFSNMDEGIREHDLGQQWDDIAMDKFAECYKKLNPANPAQAYYHMSVSRIGYLSFSDINVALRFRRTDHHGPGYRLWNIAQYLEKYLNLK